MQLGSGSTRAGRPQLASRSRLATHSGAGAQRKGLAEAGAPFFMWLRGTEGRWSHDGRQVAEPHPAQCQGVGATGYMGSCPGVPWLSPGRRSGGGMEHPCCLQWSASPVSTSSTLLASALPGLVFPHPCFRGAGARHHPSFRVGQKGDKTSLSPRAPWGWGWLELPYSEGASLRTGVQQVGGPAPLVLRRHPPAPRGTAGSPHCAAALNYLLL